MAVTAMTPLSGSSGPAFGPDGNYDFETVAYRS